jgi:hypothetical protein
MRRSYNTSPSSRPSLFFNLSVFVAVSPDCLLRADFSSSTLSVLRLRCIFHKCKGSQTAAALDLFGHLVVTISSSITKKNVYKKTVPPLVDLLRWQRKQQKKESKQQQ